MKKIFLIVFFAIITLLFNNTSSHDHNFLLIRCETRMPDGVVEEG